MRLLAFDTTSEHGGAAIYRDHQCLASTVNQGPPNYSSVTLFQMVGRLLSTANLSLRDIDLFAVANGPGSFTGIRVGVAAAQGWAKALHRPVKGILVLDAMVEAAGPSTARAAAILDARREDFFVKFYRRVVGENCFEPDGEAMVVRPHRLRSLLEELAPSREGGAAVTCVVRAHDQASQALQRIIAPSFQWRSVAGCLVDSMARLALWACRQGRLESPAQLDAYYIRRSDAEILFRRPYTPGRRAGS